MTKKPNKLLKFKNFGLILGFLIASILSLNVLFPSFYIFDAIDERLMDIYFGFKAGIGPQKISEGAFTETLNPKINNDIFILAIDSRTLQSLGRWPFPRTVHADLINNFARIKNSLARENSLFLDIFFIEQDRQPTHDFALTQAIKDNGKVFLETVLTPNSPSESVYNEYFERQKILHEKGNPLNVYGDWENIPAYYGMEPPLYPMAVASKGYGHANAQADTDDVYRRIGLINKLSETIQEIPYDDLRPDLSGYEKNYQRFAYMNKQGEMITIPSPLTQEKIDGLKTILDNFSVKKIEDLDGDGTPDREFYIIRKLQDYFIPSITLSLALNYFNKSFKDIKITFGKEIYIENPQIFDTTTGELKKYEIFDRFEKDVVTGELIPIFKTIPEIRIPIDKMGRMLINFMGKRSSPIYGESQTFQVRSFWGYVNRTTGLDSETWPETRAVENKIIMVGPFAQGMADDEKLTPFGLMYGVEIHANALNTITMSNFLVSFPSTATALILFLLIMLVSFMVTRTGIIPSFLVTTIILIGFFLTILIVFDFLSIVIPFSSIGIGVFFTFIVLTIYRVITEEKDKNAIRVSFGKYLSPEVVSQMIDNPPELGGIDKELTVLFSDIRGFTTLSESMTPQELVNHLNLYLTAMTDTIVAYKGTLDKYVGDEIMCFWGAPLEQKNHAILAAKCALKQMQVLNELNAHWPENRRINIGIGLNSGVMTVGNMGSPGKMNYTLMGDNVNLGARLEGTNKEYFTNVIISENTYAYIKDTAIVRELDNIRVKGKNRPVLIYELLDFTDGFEPKIKDE